LNSRIEIDTILKGAGFDSFLNYSIASDEIDSKMQKEIFVKNTLFKIDSVLLDKIDSVLENTFSYGSRTKSPTVTELKTKNDFIRKSMELTFKLDQIQREIALQIPDGPQRIRGLAGTGKTVILSMKAALAHKNYPDYNILFLFNTQSMYNQILKYINDYYIAETKSIPDYDKLNILHAWGGKSKAGLYFNVCRQYGINPRTFMEVRKYVDPLEGIYIELLASLKGTLKPMYDLVLIDEAQDFSPALFETIYYLTKDPKRIVWAYDEFQSLKELKIKEPEELFGKNDLGEPNISNDILEGKYIGNINKDFVLPNSYRNPRVNLMLGHGIGMSLYNKEEIIPIEDSGSWIARGYKVIKPEMKTRFEHNDKVIVERPETYSKNILERILKEQGLDEKELIQINTFKSVNEELDFIVKQVEQLIKQENVVAEEIIIITLDHNKSESEFEYLRKELDKKDIKAITPGYIEKTDQFKEKGFVTLTTTYRAKGNESNIVFVFNCQNIINNTTYRMRNAFFVSVTRSRGWCYISGHGKNSEKLKKEINDIKADYPQFIFNFPSEEDIKRRMQIISSGKNLEKMEDNIDQILKDDTYKSLLIEKISKDALLSAEIKRSLKNDN